MSFRPGGADVAVCALPNGKLDLVLDTAGPNRGNFRFDNTRAHTVLTSVVRKKGKYYWDGTGQAGTLIYTVKDDRQSTKQSLQAYAEDGCGQAQSKRYISSYQVQVQRPATGRYLIGISWTIPGSLEQQKGSLRL
jgi:hypothetical protein